MCIRMLCILTQNVAAKPRQYACSDEGEATVNGEWARGRVVFSVEGDVWG